MEKSVIAVVPGSFDPITLGHLDIINRAAAVFNEVIVAVGRNTTKNYMFEPNKRFELVCDAVSGIKNVRAASIGGLLIDFCRENGASVIVKGVRFGSDFDYELQMAQMNRALGGIETVLLPAGREFGTVSSSILREVAHNGGDISQFVTPAVNQAVLERLS